VVFCAIAGLAPSVDAQSVFPVRLDYAREESAATVQARGGVAINTGTHFLRRVTLGVTPQTAEDLFTVTASLDDTTLFVRVFATAVESGTTGPSSMLEEMKLAIFDSTAGSWSSLQELAGLNVVGGGAIDIGFDIVDEVMTVSVTTPVNLDLATLWIEATTNKSVVFTQLY
jgi:hypothetical protein